MSTIPIGENETRRLEDMATRWLSELKASPRRLGHARVGQALQLFWGPRMKPRRIGYAQCVMACEVRLDFDKDQVELEDGPILKALPDLDAFAVRDGFHVSAAFKTGITPWGALCDFWRETHAERSAFGGALIRWGDTFRGGADAG